AGRAAAAVVDLFRGIDTVGIVEMEILSRQIPMTRDTIDVTRDGVALTYGPVVGNPEIDADYFGTYDDFNFPDGATFCGQDSFPMWLGPLLLPRFDDDPFRPECDPDDPPSGPDSDPDTIKEEEGIYCACCMPDEVDTQFRIILPFALPDPILPVPETLSTRITVARINDRLIATLPGEPVSVLAEIMRSESPEAFGASKTMLWGYAQDYEGYLMTANDWLQGGYETSINSWGPLQGEYIMQQALDLARLLTTTETEEPGGIERPVYDPAALALHPLPEGAVVPEDTVHSPNPAGTVSAEPGGTVPAGGTASLRWYGGDTTIDAPAVVMERLGAGGDYEPVVGDDGHAVDETGCEVVLLYEALPVRDRADHDHIWTALWDVGDRGGGPYRFHVAGTSYDGIDGEFPFDGVEYELFSETFVIGGVE
ncbi:hypothetical protein ACFL4G_13445, partial [Thermodesulfobacteriota bacterium]